MTAHKEIARLSHLCTENNSISPDLYNFYNVKKGLREQNGKGVLTGLTEISTVNGSREENGNVVPIPGELYYRGISVNALTDGFLSEDRFGYEETVYLLLFGILPDAEELENFKSLISYYRRLPENFLEDVILKVPNDDIMNSMSRSILSLNSYDKNSNDLSISNVLLQCIRLISSLPLIAAYSYLSYRHYIVGKGLYIHNPKPDLSTAENLLRLLRLDKKYTPLEAKLLDLALVLHAEHGGGNNSTFTTHVVTSSGSDTYSSTAASICSLKGPKHGGANIKAKQMMDEIKENVSDWNDKEELESYLLKILRKDAFDKSGLIYGIGHPIYTISDPRAELFKKYSASLAEEKGCMDELVLRENIVEIAPKLMQHERHMYKPVCANIDFYSSFVFSMLDIPEELYTPIFAIARVAGWSAHRIEELTVADKIIRPAYMSVKGPEKYVPLNERQ